MSLTCIACGRVVPSGSPCPETGNGIHVYRSGSKREDKLVKELRQLADNHDDIPGYGEICKLYRRAAARIEEQRRQIDFLEQEGT